jgi:hypothetical protein
MKRTYAKNRKHLPNRRGAAFVLIVVLIVVIIGMVAFATEVGRMFLLRGEVQNAVDAGAIAAALQLREGANATAQAAAIAKDFVQRNRAGSSVTIPEDMIEVEVGRWDGKTKVFTPTIESPSAVRVFARQREPFFFAKIFGHTWFAAPAAAIATGGGGALDIIMVLDLSGSMSDEGRIEALQNAAPSFVEIIENFGADDQIGVMGYGVIWNKFSYPKHGYGTPDKGVVTKTGEWVGVLEAELGDDFAGLRTNILSTSNLLADKYGGGTPTGASIRDGAHYVVNAPTSRDEVEKVMVLMSDGHANKSPVGVSADQYARNMAVYAAGLGVKVYTISLGSEADVALMQSIADACGGLHFDATGAGEALLTERLTEAFLRIAVAIKRTQLVD